MTIRLLLVILFALSASPVLAQRAKAKHKPSIGANARTMNLSTVRESELDALPSIGPATAKKIIAGRSYSSISDLKRAGIPKGFIDNIAPLVSVGGSFGSATWPVPSSKVSSQAGDALGSPLSQAQCPARTPSPGVWLFRDEGFFNGSETAGTAKPTTALHERAGGDPEWLPGIKDWRSKE